MNFTREVEESMDTRANKMQTVHPPLIVELFKFWCEFHDEIVCFNEVSVRD
jgi:hypothetical protein